MKIVCCAGGLGNQMFQYAFYNYLKNRGFRVRFDVSSRQLERHTGFELLRVFPHIRVRAKTDEAGWIRRAKHAAWSLGWKHDLPLVGRDSGVDVRERPFREMFFCGYWQQRGYVDEMRGELLRDFQFVPINERNSEAAKRICETESVSIHIRRGDYLLPENADMARICTLEYYRSAIEWIQQRLDNPHFIVFSDDMEWVKQNFPLTNAFYIDWNQGPDSFRDMQLMTLCKHNIIANSTFSWWGAWLNGNERKMVVVPEKWGTSWPVADWLVCEGWHVIEV